MQSESPIFVSQPSTHKITPHTNPIPSLPLAIRTMTTKEEQKDIVVSQAPIGSQNETVLSTDKPQLPPTLLVSKNQPSTITTSTPNKTQSGNSYQKLPLPIPVILLVALLVIFSSTFIGVNIYQHTVLQQHTEATATTQAFLNSTTIAQNNSNATATVQAEPAATVTAIAATPNPYPFKYRFFTHLSKSPCPYSGPAFLLPFAFPLTQCRG